jgi:hypothetical protein
MEKKIMRFDGASLAVGRALYRRSLSHGTSRCFSLFFQEFTASDVSFMAEILGFRRFGG